MNYLKTHLNLIVAIAFLILVVIFFAAVYHLKFNKNKVPQINIAKSELPVDQVPQLFPKDVPIEKGAKITQNYNATSPDGRFQATRTFETKKDLSESFKIYEDYFKKNGWEVQASLDQENYKMLYAYKNKGFMQVSMNNNTTSGVKFVDISFTTVNVGVPGAAITKQE